MEQLEKVIRPKESFSRMIGLLRSTIPDMGIAWGDFFIGKALYDLTIRGKSEVLLGWKA